MVIIKTKEEIKKIREACWIVADTLKELKAAIEVGITTITLDHFARELTRLHKAKPAFLGYKGYPYTICASVNDEVVHGFPNNKPLRSGDIVTIDYGAFYKGWYGDAAFTAIIGEVSDRIEKLVTISKECLDRGIEKAIPEGRLGDISSAIQTCAEDATFNTIKKYTGHGIGLNLHESPAVLNYGKAGEGLLLKEGMVLAIEPIVSEGTDEVIRDQNKWTARTKDGSFVSQFEHTVVITKDEPVILTTNE